MYISLNWLRDFVDIPKDINAEEFGHNFTLRTAEVEHVEDEKKKFENMVVGQIKKISPHPNADKLQITQTNVGGETLQILCGAPNIKEGMLVAVALPGAQVRWHGEGDLITLEKAKIRGEESYGMICAGEEIGLEPTPGEITDLSHLKVKAGTPLAEALNKDDTILEIDNKSLTHRPDLWGHYGIARETSVLLGSKLKPVETKVEYPKNDKALSVEIKDKELCPRYIGVLVEEIKIGPSPEWMQKRLEAVGYRPISNIVDATNYVMAELGQPMHAFDAEKVEGGIVVRTAEPKEKIQTLDEVERKLSKEMLVIADHKKPIAIAGVMGGLNSEISEKTTRIILESANFNPSSVRRTSTKLGLRTEAVQRFEKSLDPNLAEQAMDRLCGLILEMCPEAKIVSSKVDAAYFETKPQTTTLNLDRVNSKIGAYIPADQVKKILTSLDFRVKEKSKKEFEVEIPSFRSTKDVEIEDDLVEEIARIYGYENINAQLPDLPTKLPEENIERVLKHRARQILSMGLGFNEVFNYSFYNIDDINKCLLPEELHEQVDNYLSEEQTHMRVSLVPNMLKNVVTNLKNYPEFKIYEVGRTYEDLQEYFPIEEKKICGMVVRGKKHKEEVFFEAKGALEKLLAFYQTAGLEMRKGEALCTYAHPNKYAAYYDRKTGEEIARVFELHPTVAKNYELEDTKIAVFEINFTKLATYGFKELKYQPLPKYPDITIDISVVIDKKVEIGELLKTIKNVDKTLIRKVDLFDLYEGPNIPEDKKAVAFNITLRADDRTLTDEEMKKVQNEIFARLKKLGGDIRGL
jgi:phenylalanyl-tRNA synthetase beta chain